MIAAAAEERFERLEERTDSLELILGQFMVSTHKSLSRLERCTERLERSIEDFKVEMKDFKDESRRQSKEAERDRKEMNRKWGDLANKMGTLVEDIVAPNISRILKKYFHEDELEYFAVRVKKMNEDKTARREFDVIAVSGDYFLVNETKSTPRPEYAKEFKDALPQINDYFPEYASRKLIPVFSSLYIPPDIQTFLSNNDIYAVAMKDDTMEVLNFEDVRKNPSAPEKS